MNEDCFHLGAKALITNAGGKLLLLKRHSGDWDIPGGRIQKQESVAEALQREVYEETGLQIEEIKPFAMVLTERRIQLQPGDVGLILSVYRCSVRGDKEVRIGEEHADFSWFESVDAAEALKGSFPDELIGKLLEENRICRIATQ